MPTTAGVTAAHLLPVPGAEHLRWVGAPLAFAPRPRCNPLPVVVAAGGADAGLFHLARIERREALVSRRLDDAFASWPPTPGEPVEQLARDFGNVPARIVAWPGGRFVMTSHGGLVGRWDRATEAREGRLSGWATRDGAVYVPAQRDGVGVYEHLAGEALDQVTLVGARPAESRTTLGGVTGSGVLWLACVDRPPPRDVTMALTVDILRGVPGELRACGSFTCPAGSYPSEVLGRDDGGAWVVMEGKDGSLVQGIDAAGVASGHPWQLPFADVFRGERTFASWGDGFAVAIRVSPVALLISDGVHTTRVQGDPGGSASMGRHPSLAIAPDGRGILVAYQTIDGFQVVRAEVSAASGSGEVASDPWEQDRDVRRRRAERAAHLAANPPPPRQPGHPVGPIDESAPSLRSRGRFVRQVFLRATLQAIAAGQHDEGSRFDGDHRAGAYVEPNGCGDHVAFAWGPEGIVAVAFDHEMNDEAGIDHELLNPERHFARVPDQLAPLVQRAIAAANREVTGAVWITEGPEARWDEVGRGTDRLVGFSLTAEEVLFGTSLLQTWLELLGPSEAQGRLAIELSAAAARGERRVITAQEEEVLFAGRDGVAPDPRRVARSAAMLDRLGVAWPDAVERAKAASGADADRGYALLDAVARGDVPAVRALLDGGANVRKRSRPGQLGRRWSFGGATPLLVALEARDVALSTMLLEAGADPSGITAGTSPLSSAAHAGSRELCELLLKRGADVEEVRGSIFYAAVAGRSAEVVELFLDLGVESGMSVHWWDQFEAIAKGSGRLDLLERIPEPAHVTRYRADRLPNARMSARKFMDDARNYIRLRHIIFAMRGIHEEVPGASTFEGTHEAGRHAWTDAEGGGEVLAWNEHGMVAWAFDPRVASPSAEVHPSPVPAPVAFADAPPELRELAETAAAWPLAHGQATDAFWVFPAAAELGGFQGRWGRQPSSFVPHGDAYGVSAMDPRTPGWPREALALRRELATRAYAMSRLTARGEYPEVTETDAALMMLPKGKRARGRGRDGGVATAVELLAQIGIRWDTAGTSGGEPTA